MLAALTRNSAIARKTAAMGLSVSLALCFLACALPVGAQELSKQAKIERILDLTNSQAMIERTFDQITSMIDSQMKAQMPNASSEAMARTQEIQKKLMDLMKSRFSWEKMRPEFVRIYGETYSDEEIDGLLAFYQSAAGQGFIRKSPELTQKILAVSQSQLGDLMPEIQRITKEAAEKKP